MFALVVLQTPFGPSSFAELLSAPYSEDASVSLPEELDPFHDVVFPQGPDPAPLPSFQETYASLGFKMDDECYNVAAAPTTPYHHHHHHPAAPSQYEYQQQHHYPSTPYYPQQPTGFDPTPQESYSLPHFPSPTAELSVNTSLAPARQRRASLPLQRSESTR